MILSKEGMCMIEGHEALILAETEMILTSVYVNLVKSHGEEQANELFAMLGRAAIEGADGYEDRVEHIK